MLRNWIPEEGLPEPGRVRSSVVRDQTIVVILWKRGVKLRVRHALAGAEVVVHCGLDEVAGSEAVVQIYLAIFDNREGAVVGAGQGGGHRKAGNDVERVGS